MLDRKLENYSILIIEPMKFLRKTVAFTPHLPSPFEIVKSCEERPFQPRHIYKIDPCERVDADVVALVGVGNAVAVEAEALWKGRIQSMPL